MDLLKFLKFGGGPIREPDNVRRIKTVSDRDPSRITFVIMSAIGKTTNRIEKMLDKNLPPEVQQELREENRKFHTRFLVDLGIPPEDNGVWGKVSGVCTRITQMARRATGSDQAYSKIVAEGEILSSLIVHAYLEREYKNDSNVTVLFVDAKDYIKTVGATHKECQVDYKTTREELRKLYRELTLMLKKNPDQRIIVVTQGFIGSNIKNEPTTLGREGSDYSATTFTVAIDEIANDVQKTEVIVWKNVDGLMTADPNNPATSKDAKLIRSMTIKEAFEFSHQNAQVLHKNTIDPLKEISEERKGKVRLSVRNLFNLEDSGTVIED